MPVEYQTPAIEDRAVAVQTLLADQGRHRAPSVPDLIVAATAELLASPSCTWTRTSTSSPRSPRNRPSAWPSAEQLPHSGEGPTGSRDVSRDLVTGSLAGNLRRLGAEAAAPRWPSPSAVRCACHSAAGGSIRLPAAAREMPGRGPATGRLLGSRYRSMGRSNQLPITTSTIQLSSMRSATVPGARTAVPDVQHAASVARAGLAAPIQVGTSPALTFRWTSCRLPSQTADGRQQASIRGRDRRPRTEVRPWPRRNRLAPAHRANAGAPATPPSQ